MDYVELRDFREGLTVRSVVFYLSIVAFLVLLPVRFGARLLSVFPIWLDATSAGSEFVHEVALTTGVWVLVAAMAVQLFRPEDRVPAMQVALVVASVTLLIESFLGAFDPTLFVFLAPVFVAAGLHPARSELFGRDTGSGRDAETALLALAGLALVPVLLYALGQVNHQATLADEHAVLGHYASMVAFSLTFLALTALAALDGTDRHPGAYAAALMAVVLATASLYPPTASAIDATWAVLAIVWSIAVVAGTEWIAYERTRAGSEAAADEPIPTS